MFKRILLREIEEVDEKFIITSNERGCEMGATFSSFINTMNRRNYH